MGRRSPVKMRSIMWRLVVAALLLLSVLPRLTLHSHAALCSNGADAATLAQHLSLFHGDPSKEVPVDALHLHWALGPCSGLLPSATASAVTDTGHHGTWLTGAVHDCCLPLPTETLVTEFSAGQVIDESVSRGDSNRATLCVWNC